MKLKIETIILVRHAKALDRGLALAQGIGEAARPLTDEGISKFQKRIKKYHKVFADTDLFVTSPYVRAADTLDLLLAETQRESAEIEISKLIEPEKKPELFIKWLNQRTEKNIAFVSHEPFMSNFLNAFLKADVSFLKIRKGAIIILQYQQDENIFKLTDLL